ncbi:hypothetical protein SPFL3102_01771 [Sporomusaceae bacterium FL31]|nr:hypothetical protein SPFL3101_03405 [Sporomusaceae bacterium FL31]GCE33962.1 hypothetical protein SPFL3102_01771 [Sporomusaceae bacterium]
MADLKQRMSRHLRSARQWLTRAEESFDKESDIRAELDLMLAQAELQHAKETKRAGEWRYKYLVMRHGFALGLAMLIAVGGLGGAFYMIQGRQTVIPPSIAEQPSQSIHRTDFQVVPDTATVPKTSSAEAMDSVSARVSEVPAIVQAQPVSMKATDRQEMKVQQHKEAADSGLELPPDEMQKLMRAAGKSLRGQ